MASQRRDHASVETSSSDSEKREERPPVTKRRRVQLHSFDERSASSDKRLRGKRSSKDDSVSATATPSHQAGKGGHLPPKGSSQLVERINTRQTALRLRKTHLQEVDSSVSESSVSESSPSHCTAAGPSKRLESPIFSSPSSSTSSGSSSSRLSQEIPVRRSPRLADKTSDRTSSKIPSR